MKIAGNTVAPGEGTERRQPIRLTRGLYGGVLSSYSAPKIYKNLKSGEDEEKFYVRFLITHDGGSRSLPKPTDAFCGVRTKLFYDAQKDVASTMVRLFAALLNGKLSPEEIAAGADLPDLDDLICWPAMVYIKPAASPDKDGIVSNVIDTNAGGFLAADPAYRQEAKGIYKSADMAYGERSSLRYLKSPTAEFETAGAPARDNGLPAGGDDVDDGEIPW